MEYYYGHGLVGLIHPVTKEFNHEAVIARNGRGPVVGSLGDFYVPHMLYAVGSIVRTSASYVWTLQDKQFDRYDSQSVLYGWAAAITDTTDDSAQVTSSDQGSDCFVSLFEMIGMMNILDESVNPSDANFFDITRLFNTWNIFTLTVFNPVSVFNNLGAVYEHCNGFVYWTYARNIANRDYGFIGEISTRIVIIATEELGPFYTDMTNLLGATNVDYYLVGFRIGMVWQSLFDIKLNSS